MDDLLSEDWQAPPKPTTSAPPPSAQASASNYSSFRASPVPSQSGVTSPQTLSRPSSTVNGTSKPASDTFGNLLSLKSQKAASNVSIEERLRRLAEEKRKQQEQQSQLLDNLGSGRGTPEARQPSPAIPQEDDDDLLAAFNKAAPVDRASHFPPPNSTGVSGRATPAAGLPAQTSLTDTGAFDEDDDTFGLAAASKRSNGHAIPPVVTRSEEEDDILGDLGKPVTERPAQPARGIITEPSSDEEDVVSVEQHRRQVQPVDRSLAELVDMGFPADTAKIALAENGGSVQGAVGWLLQQAHEESKQKAQKEARTRRRSPVAGSRSPPRRQRGEPDGVPAWMRQEGRASSSQRRQDESSTANGEKDATQVAQELGSKLFKSANSLFKGTRQQMAKTMAEFQQERDPSQPRWMQETSADSSRASSQQRRPEERTAPRAAASRPTNATAEASMLDMPREVRSSKPARPPAPEQVHDSPARGRSPIEPLPDRPASQTRPRPQPSSQQDKRPATKLSKQEVDDQTAQAYVSPARRKRPTPQPEPQPRQEPEVDLFSPAPSKLAAATVPATTVQASSTPRPPPPPTRTHAPPRNIPSVSPSALSSSAHHRKAGGEAFKRGDYAAAHEFYTAALLPLPATHPIMIIVLTNRSLTALKTGDAKTAFSDSDRALEMIGPAQGMGETISLGAGEENKDMRDFYGKALMRKAEALEHLERWTDAALVWRQAIEAGVGGAVSLRGRDRCEKAAAPAKPATAAKPVRSMAPRPGRAPIAKSMGNSQQRPALTSVSSPEAVRKLREANAAAERADDEKFALTDQVDARLAAWKGGKADNLRALLQSLDSVLWEGAGWKKVGMSDLVMPPKVKIVYMKAIGKVHPDKIPQDATTEQRMVSAAVFSTLNEAWDKFKRDNNL